MDKVDQFLKNPKKALFSLAYPITIGMVFQTLYNVVDTAFVGRLGPDALAAVTFAFPMFFFLMALNSGIGTGMGSLISRSLGNKNKRQAEKAAMHGLLMSIVLAAIVFSAAWIFLPQIFRAFGAQGNVLDLSLGYMRIVLLGVFFMLPSYVMNSIFSSQGDTKTPVRIQIASLGLNIILDPIFIFLLGLGVAGAAIATSISFAFALVLYIIFMHKKSEIRLPVRKFRHDWSTVYEILKVGAPASLMMIVMSVYVMFINAFMAHYSTDHVAAFGISSRLESFVAMPIAGLSIGLMTLSGMFYGAHKYEVMKKTVWYGVRTAALLASAIGLVFFIFPSIFLRIFTDSPQLIAIGSRYLRVDVFTFPLMAVSFCVARALQGMGYGVPGLIINLTRIIFVAVPLAYLFVYYFGLGFIWVAYAMVAGGVASNIVAIIWLKVKFSQL